LPNEEYNVESMNLHSQENLLRNQKKRVIISSDEKFYEIINEDENNSLTICLPPLKLPESYFN